MNPESEYVSPPRFCGECEKPIDFIDEWQQSLPHSCWIGHKECAQNEAQKHVVVQRADLKYLLDVYIDNGMVEPEDAPIINRLAALLSAT